MFHAMGYASMTRKKQQQKSSRDAVSTISRQKRVRLHLPTALGVEQVSARQCLGKTYLKMPRKKHPGLVQLLSHQIMSCFIGFKCWLIRLMLVGWRFAGEQKNIEYQNLEWMFPI